MLLSILMAASTLSPKPISVVDFGAVPNLREDATEAVTRALAAAPSGATVLFPRGEYHFYREKGHRRNLYLSNSDVANPRHIAILIEGRSRLRLQGQGARLVFHDRIIPFAILASRNIALDGFEVDWERPLMSQGRIVAADAGGITLEIDAERYPYVIEDGRLFFTDRTWKREPWDYMRFDPETRGVAYRTGDAGAMGGDWRDAKVSEPQPGIVRLDYPNSGRQTVGHFLVARHGTRDHGGTFIQDSQKVALSNMAYRHTSGLGILAQYSQDLTFRKVEVAPKEGSGRLFAGHDDGIHLSNCKGKVLVDQCRFEGLMDDPINVHGTTVPITAILGADRLRCRFSHGQSLGLRFADPGDTVSYLDRETLLSRGTAKVLEVVPISEGEFEVVFAGRIPEGLVVGDALENLTWAPSFTVRRSVFGPVRARGLLVSTPGKVLIEDNHFRSSGSAILIAGDANQWYESGAVKDVTIRRNRFDNCLTSTYQFCEAV
ncbi:MAG TPA: hypothetical protein VGE01_14205, partial [Fimbriimonas sp.]